MNAVALERGPFAMQPLRRFEGSCGMSSPIAIDIPHTLGAAEARRRIDQGFAQLASRWAAAPSPR